MSGVVNVGGGECRGGECRTINQRLFRKVFLKPRHMLISTSLCFAPQCSMFLMKIQFLQIPFNSVYQSLFPGHKIDKGLGNKMRECGPPKLRQIHLCCKKKLQLFCRKNLDIYSPKGQHFGNNLLAWTSRKLCQPGAVNKMLQVTLVVMCRVSRVSSGRILVAQKWNIPYNISPL